MILDGIHRAGLNSREPSCTGEKESPRGQLGSSTDIATYLTGLRKGIYDQRAAEILAFASSWAYSDVSTFAFAMAQRGLYGCDCVCINLANDVLFVDASAYLLQSKDCKTTILCFRGTEPTNAINWLSDLSARPESFLSAGKVHGGFHRTIRAMWPLLKPLLCSASRGESICEKLKAMDGQWLKRCPAPQVNGTQTQLQEPLPQEHPEASCDTQAANAPEFKAALYVAGHSLGGALAVLAAVLIDWDDDLHKKSDFLRGVYTYGQPMVGDYTFFREHREGVGQMVFRHVYGRDIVPRLPPLAMGCFRHIGREYRSSDAGWELQVWPVPHVLTLGLSNLVGVLAWFTQDVLPLHGLKLPLSWGHHSPMNYMRTSMMASPGAEFDPSAPAPAPEDC